MKALITTTTLIFSLNSYALTPQQQQLTAIRQVEQQEQQRVDMEQQAQQQRAAARVRQQNEAHARANKAAQQKKAEQQTLRNKQADIVMGQEKKELSYQNELHDLDIQKRQLELQEAKAKAARTNDYIDQDLGRQKAETDVIQSQADANRNVSEGDKNISTSVGKAAENKSKGWFD